MAPPKPIFMEGLGGDGTRPFTARSHGVLAHLGKGGSRRHAFPVWVAGCSRDLVPIFALAVFGLSGLLVVGGCTRPAPPPGETVEETEFSLRVRGAVNPYPVLGVYVPPDETVPLQILPGTQEVRFRAECDGGNLVLTGPHAWQWQAPSVPGLYRVHFSGGRGPPEMTLNVFVMVPRDAVRDGALEGYRIGTYPETPFRGEKIYRPPAGYVRVTPENSSAEVSPHFTLGQFVSKQGGGYPKFVVLREALLLKLEMVLDEVRDRGWGYESLHIMSGYRTPAYNATLGNVPHGRHLFGDAADIFLDEKPRDGVMDDLNGDGRSDVRDAELLFDVIDSLEGRVEWEPYVGGLGLYTGNTVRGPFVHVDARGKKARWRQ